ncbi:hypothetical protein [Streptomyces sp. PR69]|uniref:restriction endonuclease subunit S n=1 Tax=Streptomyces sp. PR69 TaxID=2984950 RepID=UPI002263D282|nr:hypothetical protein [Streptomyces sp. PR69]
MGDRVGELADRAVVLSSTKHHGLVRSDEYFKNRQIYSDDISHYKLVRRGWFAYATNHLNEGSIGLQRGFDYGCVSPIYTVFSCGPQVDPSFLFRVLKSERLVSEYRLHDQASVDRRGAVRYRDFSRIEVDLPSLEEQRRIVKILDEVDFQLDRAMRQREKLAVAASADVAAILHAVSSVSSVEWTTLDQVAAISAGVTLGNDEQEAAAVTLPYLRVANVQDGYIDTADIKYVTIRCAEVERYRLRAGDVLLTEGGDLDKLGRGGVWEGRIDPCLHQNHIFKVRCDRDRILPRFLAEYLASPSGKSYFLGVAKQTTNLASVNSTQVKRVPIPLVPLGGQRSVLASIEKWEQRIAVADQEIVKVAALKQGLLSELLSDSTACCTTPSNVASLPSPA